MELAQFYPDRISITYKKDYRFGDASINIVNKICNQNSLKNLGKKKTSFSLSRSSIRNIKDSITAMYILSKPHTVKINNKKFIYNFRQSFITLTLPSNQCHSDVVIKQCLDRFLTVLRRNFKVQNYVWKAELQQNKNIHFHLTIDKYIHYNALRYYWNNAINQLNYVDNYSKKMSKLTISEYATMRNKSINEIKDVFMRGVRSGWSHPNSVDVRAVLSGQGISNYLSKYFAKESNDDDDVLRISKFGRVWSRSTSLSKLKFKNKIEFNEIKQYINELLQYPRAVCKKVYDFATVFYIKFELLPKHLTKLFLTMNLGNAKFYDYPLNTT